jgi:hypothetical protein
MRPDALSPQRERRCLDARDQVRAAATAGAVREPLHAAPRDPHGADQIAALLQHLRPVAERARRQLVIGPASSEILHGLAVALGHLSADRLVAREFEPPQIGVDPRRPIAVAAMEAQHVLVEPHGPQRGGERIGRGRTPGEERVGVCEHRAAAIENERFLGARAGLLTRLIEAQRVERDEIVERRPPGVGRVAARDEHVPCGDRCALQPVRAGERRLEVPVDLGVEARQVPGREVVGRLHRRLRALHDAPAILLEVLPVPVRQDRFVDGTRPRRSLRQLGLERVDLLFRLAALDLALVGDPLGGGAHRLGQRAVRHGVGGNRVEDRDRGLRQTRAARGLDPFPCKIATVAGCSQDEYEEDSEHPGRERAFHTTSCPVAISAHERPENSDDRRVAAPIVCEQYSRAARRLSR